MVTVLALVLAGHFVGDWIVQTDYQAAAKVTSWWANQQHVLGYHLAMGVLVAPVWHDRWALAALAVSWVSHSFIDRRWPVRWLMRHTGSGPFSETTFGVIAVDQALHLTFLCLLTAAVR